MRISDWSSDVCSSDLTCRVEYAEIARKRCNTGIIDPIGDISVQGTTIRNEPVMAWNAKLLEDRSPDIQLHVCEPSDGLGENFGKESLLVHGQRRIESFGQ